MKWHGIGSPIAINIPSRNARFKGGRVVTCVDEMRSVQVKMWCTAKHMTVRGRGVTAKVSVSGPASPGACPGCQLPPIHPHPVHSPSPAHPRILPPPIAPPPSSPAPPVVTNVAAEPVASKRDPTLVTNRSSPAVATRHNDAAGGREGIDVYAEPVANVRSETPISPAPTLLLHVVVGVSAKRGAKERSTASTPLPVSWSFASTYAARDVAIYTRIVDATRMPLTSPGMGPHTPITKVTCVAGETGVTCSGVEVAVMRVSSCESSRCVTATWSPPPPGRHGRKAAQRHSESGETPRRRFPQPPRDARVPWARAVVPPFFALRRHIASDQGGSAVAWCITVRDVRPQRAPVPLATFP